MLFLALLLPLAIRGSGVTPSAFDLDGTLVLLVAKEAVLRNGRLHALLSNCRNRYSDYRQDNEANAPNLRACSYAHPKN